MVARPRPLIPLRQTVLQGKDSEHVPTSSLVGAAAIPRMGRYGTAHGILLEGASCAPQALCLHWALTMYQLESHALK
ncbi:hypothetical protein Aduo_011862 [Ancylostoma duodenale]